MIIEFWACIQLMDGGAVWSYLADMQPLSTTTHHNGINNSVYRTVSFQHCCSEVIVDGFGNTLQKFQHAFQNAQDFLYSCGGSCIFLLMAPFCMLLRFWQCGLICRSFGRKRCVHFGPQSGAQMHTEFLATPGYPFAIIIFQKLIGVFSTETFVNTDLQYGMQFGCNHCSKSMRILKHSVHQHCQHSFRTVHYHKGSEEHNRSGLFSLKLCFFYLMMIALHNFGATVARGALGSSPHVLDRCCVVDSRPSDDCNSNTDGGLAFLTLGQEEIHTNFITYSCLMVPDSAESFGAHIREIEPDPFSCIGLTKRFGEADHPGPSGLVVGSINPTQLFNKEYAFNELEQQIGQGFWGISESAHTQVSMQVSQHRLKKDGWFSCWSKPTEAHKGGKSVFRGKAGGTCIVARERIRPGGEGLPSTIVESTRLTESFIQIGVNTVLKLICIYLPPRNETYSNVDLMVRTVANCAFQRAQDFHGPSIIVGDFNTSLDSIDSWTAMRSRGWHDLHEKSAEVHGHMLQTTCFSARHSFVCGNQIATSALIECRVTDTYHFATHPALWARFSWETITRFGEVWSLPASTDDFIFDMQLLQNHADKLAPDAKSKIVEYLQNGDSNKAMARFVTDYERCLQVSCVDIEGNRIHLPAKCLGKNMRKPFGQKSLSMPVIRQGRPGDPKCSVQQPDVSLRRHTKQLRRLQSLVWQLNALQRHFSIHASLQCDELWMSIRNATGFEKSFDHWLVEHFCGFVPVQTPTIDFMQVLLQHFQIFHRRQEGRVIAARQKDRRLSIAIDIEKGGRKVFQEIKEPPKTSLTHVAFWEDIPIKPIRWTKRGNDVLRLFHMNNNLTVGEKILFQQQEATVLQIDHHNYVISLDKKLRLKNANQQYIQIRRDTTEPEIMQQQTAKAWNCMWQRDQDPLNTEQWEDACHFMTCLNDCPSMEHEEFEIDIWLKQIQKIPPRSSRGACAFSRRELLIMPESFISLLFILFAAFETFAPWPDLWMISRVICLPKSDCPNDPLDIRPITILSRMYRQWSAYRSSQVLQHLKRLVPPQVSGAIGCVSANMLAALTMVTAEKALYEHDVSIGAVLDIKKCFNCIPRLPIYALLKAIGVPTMYIRGLARMHQQFIRFLEIGGCVGDPHTSTTGLPEGDSFSVSCMTAISYLVSRIPHIGDSNILPVFFADNWSVIAREFDKFTEAVEAIFDFVNKWRMEISHAKSWLWSTKPSIRQRLKKLEVHGKNIPVRNSAVDLGCDIHYGKGKAKMQFQKRLKSAVVRLRKTRRICAPNRFKRKLIKMGGHSVVMYGCELPYITEAQWHNLRTATAGAAKLKGNGCCTWIALCAIDPMIDPQLAACIRRIMFWRKFLIVFPETATTFLARVASPTMKNGPAVAFHKTLRDLGWTCLGDGWVRHFSGFCFQWTTASKKFVRQVIIYHWTFKVQHHMQHRKGCQGFTFSLALTNRVLQALGPWDQGVMCSYLCGKAFTHDILSKFTREQCPLCPMCGQEDSRLHRLWHCEGLNDIRCKYQHMFQWLTSQPFWVQQYAVAPPCDSFLCERQKSEFPWVEIGTPIDDGKQHTFFCDGSAFHPESWDLTLGASAWIRVDDQHQIVLDHDAKPLPGSDHSSFRAESYAIYLVLGQAFRVNIVGDCQAALQLLDDICHKRLNLQQVELLKHCDIWSKIFHQVNARPFGAIQWTKIQAHQEWQSWPDSFVRWCAQMNDQVDFLAKRCVHDSWPTLSQVADRIAEDRENIFSHVLQMHRYLCEAATKSMEQHIVHHNTVQVSDIISNGADRFHEQLVRGPVEYRLFGLPLEISKVCPYTQEFAIRIIQWLNQLQWPCGNEEIRPISLLELYTDFVLTTQTFAPVQLRRKGEKGRGSGMLYALRDQDMRADMSERSLRSQSRTWTRAFKWLHAHCDDLHFSTFCRVNTLRCVGFGASHDGITVRPKLVKGVQVYITLAGFFGTASRVKNLSGCFTVSRAGG